MPATQELRSNPHNYGPTLNRIQQSSAVVIKLDDQPIEGGDNPVYGDVTWRTLISADRTPTSDLLLGVAEFQAHGVLHLHRHEPAEFYLCLMGSGIVTIDGKEHLIDPGSAVFIPGNAEHGVVAGVQGMTLAYGFAQHAFTDVQYVFSGDSSSPIENDYLTALPHTE